MQSEKHSRNGNEKHCNEVWWWYAYDTCGLSELLDGGQNSNTDFTSPFPKFSKYLKHPHQNFSWKQTGATHFAVSQWTIRGISVLFLGLKHSTTDLHKCHSVKKCWVVHTGIPTPEGTWCCMKSTAFAKHFFETQRTLCLDSPVFVHIQISVSCMEVRIRWEILTYGVRWRPSIKAVGPSDFIKSGGRYGLILSSRQSGHMKLISKQRGSKQSTKFAIKSVAGHSDL
jgi:hypothetical protein